MNQSTNFRIKEILSKHTKMATESLTDDLPLENTEIDSLGMMELLFDLEDAFKIEIPEPETIEERENQFKTVGDIVEYISSIVEETQKAA